MRKIEKVIKQTQNRFLNLYQLEGKNKNGKPFQYYVASRNQNVEGLKCLTHQNPPDGVVIYSLYGEKKDRVVLIRQYRCPVGGYVYEFPAGLVEEGETYREAAVREMHEETGLRLSVLPVEEFYERPYYTTIGMTDESCATVYGYAEGEITGRYREESEEIEVVLADRDEVRRILKEEQVAIMCAYHLMHFLHDETPFAFLQ